VCTAAIFHVIKFQNRDFMFSFNFYNATTFLLQRMRVIILIVVLILYHNRIKL